MPRRAAPPKRRIPADPVYGSVLVQQLINKIMLDGKKSTAEKIVYDALSFIEERTGTNPVTVSTMHWTISGHASRSRAVAWAARPTRCRSR
jgi:ribosomal protein S7